MPVTEVTETERKYEVDDAVDVPDLAGVAGVTESRTEQPVTLRAVYFDTAGGALASAGFTLRRREGGEDEGWHLKTPSPLGRTEHRVALTPVVSGERGAPRLPQDLLNLITAWTRREPLVEVARITTVRTATTVFGKVRDGASGNAAVGDGVAGTGAMTARPVAEIADDRVSATDLKTGILRLWREWEVELLAPAERADAGKDGARAGELLLGAIEEVLVAGGATPATSSSKLARALGRTAIAPRGPSAPEDGATALGTVLAVLSVLRDSLLAADSAVRAQKDDAVHQMRIVVRRLRGALAAFRGILDPDTLDALRARLSALGDTLGVVRDAEVRHNRAQSLVTDTHTDDSALRHRLVEDTRAEYETLLAALLDYLGAEEYFALLDDIDALIARPPVTEASLQAARPALRAVLRHESRRASRRVKRADRSDLAALHDARKAARRLRYVAEALSSGDSAVLGKKTRALAESAEAVQDVLGEHRDATLFAERLENTARQATEAGENADDYAALIAEEREHARTAADALEAAARDLRQAAKA
jgi:CHAD domain-containing protein